MDDCDLEKLTIKPGKLEPAFKRDITEYHVTLGSEVDKITFDLFTSDGGASYSISNSGGSKTVPLKEGEVLDIKIEVTAEDGTVKNYFVHAKRLSARDATLSALKLNTGILTPEFSGGIYEYNCVLPSNIGSVTVAATPPDPKCVLTVNGNKPDQPAPLNVGETKIEVEVTSADGSNKQIYTVFVTKTQIPRYIKIVDSALAAELECPVSLAPLYCPVTINGSNPKHSFSGPIIDELTKTSKFDPLNEMPLGLDWRMQDFDLEKKLAQANGCIPLVYGGASENVKIGSIGEKLSTCNQTPKPQDVKDKFKSTEAPINHTIQVRPWEKQLHQIFDESNATKLVTLAKNSVQKYFEILQTSGKTQKFAEGEGPLDHLSHAACCYACALKTKSKDASVHLQLGLVLEERYYAEDMFHLKKERGIGEIAGMNLQAKESSKAEEIAAICKLHGCDPSAPLSLQLKALDTEYHQLLDNGQGDKAEHVQGLYAWKNKQATQEGEAAQKAEDQASPLGQAYLKYLDALSLDEAKAVYHFHVGRLLVIQGNYVDAVKRLEVTLNWNPQYQMARFYLGLALALQKNGPGTRAKEAISYLQEGMEILLTQLTQQAVGVETNSKDEEPKLCAENLYRLSNVHLLRGIVQLGKLAAANPDVKDCMSFNDVFHSAAYLATQVLTKISRGDTYKQFEWVLLETHSLLLEHLSANPKDNEKLITQRCERLSALIRYSTIPTNSDLLTLQAKTSQKLVTSQPCNSYALYLLGNSQLELYDNDPGSEESKQVLEDCKKSFLASIALEGKPAAGPLPEEIKGQKWWQDKVKAEEEKKKAEAASAAPAAADKAPAAAGRGAAASRGRGAATPVRGVSRGGAAARGGAVSRGAAAARGGAAAKAAPAKPAARGGPAGRGAAAAKPGAAAKTPAAPAATKQAPAPVEKPAESKPAETPAAAPVPANAPINRKTHHPRLGLARALSKDTEDLSESVKYYHEVITLAPELHDAYIESAEMIVKKDPLAAVDIYARFPVPENPSFDDAYIFQEIARLLMKAEKFDDPRLGPNLIALGRVMGLGSIEKYVETLDGKFKTDLCKTVYAGVNHKDVDDPDIQAFFKFKCWI